MIVIIERMATVITVNTAPIGQVYVGPNYRYKTLTEAFNDNQFQVIIPDEYVMEDTLLFNKDVIYSLTVLDEIKISQLNVQTDGTPLYIVFDGIGLVTFTTSNPINYLTSTNGLALYFNSTRVKSTAAFDITATLLHASNTRFASDFPMTLNSFLDTSTTAVTILDGCQFNSVTTLNNTTVADTIIINVTNCIFDEDIIIYGNSVDPSTVGSYTCFMVIDGCLLQNINLLSTGGNILSPRIRLSKSTLLTIQTTLSEFCSLNSCVMDGCSLSQGQGLLFPNLLYTTLTNNIIDDGLTISNVTSSTLMNNVISDNLSIHEADHMTFVSNNVSGEFNVPSCDACIIDSCTNLDLSTTTLTDTHITNNNGLGLSIETEYTNITVQSNTLTDNFDLPTGTGLQFCSNNANVPININVPSVTGIMFNGNYNIGLDVASATNGLVANNVGPLFTFNNLTNVTTSYNIAI